MDTGSTRLGRRALLAAGAAAVATAAAEAVVLPGRVAAADGDPLRIGASNTGSHITRLQTTAEGALALHSDTGTALIATAVRYSAISATSMDAETITVWARNHGAGTGGNLGTPTQGLNAYSFTPDGDGVYGYGNDPSGRGVRGQNLANSTEGWLGGPEGVLARAPTSRTALNVDGKVHLSRSGIATVSKNAWKKIIADVALTSRSQVFVTLQQYRSGVYVAAAQANVDSDSITIYLSKRVSAATKLAWFILD